MPFRLVHERRRQRNCYHGHVEGIAAEKRSYTGQFLKSR